MRSSNSAELPHLNRYSPKYGLCNTVTSPRCTCFRSACRRISRNVSGHSCRGAVRHSANASNRDLSARIHSTIHTAVQVSTARTETPMNNLRGIRIGGCLFQGRQWTAFFGAPSDKDRHWQTADILLWWFWKWGRIRWGRRERFTGPSGACVTTKVQMPIHEFLLAALLYLVVRSRTEVAKSKRVSYAKSSRAGSPH